MRNILPCLLYVSVVNSKTFKRYSRAKLRASAYSRALNIHAPSNRMSYTFNIDYSSGNREHNIWISVFILSPACSLSHEMWTYDRSRDAGPAADAANRWTLRWSNVSVLALPHRRNHHVVWVIAAAEGSGFCPPLSSDSFLGLKEISATYASPDK